MLDKRSRSGYCVKCSAVFSTPSPIGGLRSHTATTQHVMKKLIILPQPEIDDNIIWGCDYGSGYFHCWNGAKYLQLKAEDFASLAFAADFDTIVIENAHMQPKRESLAQVFEYQELAQIADIAAARNIEIRLWFHSQTPKWRAKLKMGDKSDEIDAKTIYAIVENRGLEGLQYFKPREQYPPRILWAHQQVADMNLIMNIARIDYEAQKCPAVNIYYEKQTGARSQSLITVCKKDDGTNIRSDINRWFFGKQSSIYGLSLWSALVDWDGNPREFNGFQPGVKFIMNELLKQKPNHFKGGTARSNIMHHCFRNIAIKHLGIRKDKTKLSQFSDEQQIKFIALRQRFRRGMVITLHAMKKYINEQMTV